MCEFCGDGPDCPVCGRTTPCGPFEVFNPVTGAVCLVTDDPADAAAFAARWGLDWAPEGWGHC